MAATNHPKKQYLPPTQARRGKLRLAQVPGGPSETARMILAGEWDKSPAALISANRYSPVLIPELAALGINVVVLTWSPGFTHEHDLAQWEIVQRLLPLLRKKRIKALAHLSVDASAANPQGHEYVAHKVCKAVEAGFDGFFFECAKDLPEATHILRGLRAAAVTHYEQLHPADACELLFCAPGWFSPDLDDVLNLKLVKANCIPGLAADAAFNTNVPPLKLAFEQGGRDKPFAVLCHCPQTVAQAPIDALSADSATKPLTDKQRRLAVAESLAAGGTCAALDLPGDYGEFLQDCPNLFAPSDPIGSIGIIIADAVGPGFAHPMPFLGAFVRANIQFDVIPLTRFEQFDFRKYKLLIAAGLQFMPEPLDNALRLFVNEHGGTTYVSASVAKEDFEASVIPGLYSTVGPQPVEVKAPEGLIALLLGKGTKRWLHVLNYRDDPCDATFSLPGCGGRKVNAYSPDEAPLTLTMLEAGPACVSFTLSGIQTYAVVEVL